MIALIILLTSVVSLFSILKLKMWKSLILMCLNSNSSLGLKNLSLWARRVWLLKVRTLKNEFEIKFLRISLTSELKMEITSMDLMRLH